MGHAIHFLERLERVSMPQADLALGLYRDPDLVRFVLASVKLPDGVERVALALEHGPDTPHVIVARDGGFVTCLGNGMVVGDHVVVSRERLDRLIAEREDVHQALARVNHSGHARQIFHRLYRSGPALPREDVRTLRAIYPLYWRELMHETIALADRLQEFRAAYRRNSLRRMNAYARDVLTRYRDAQWALGHMVGLQGTMAREITETLMPRLPDAQHVGLCASWLTTRTMSTPLVLRGAWAAARGGHALLPSYRRKFEEAATPLTIIDSLVGLTAIALRHRKLLGEVRKFLARRRNPLLAPDSQQPFASTLRLLVPSYEQILEDDGAAARAMHRHAGVTLVRQMREGAEPEHPIFSLGAEPEDTPDEIAYVLPLLIDGSLYREPYAQIWLPVMIPWVVEVDLEQLYLPANTLTSIGIATGTPLERVREDLDVYAMYDHGPGPVTVRRAPTPGRNEPCSCGSGKKYKRCCGAAA
jgi:hypothetical protein